MAIAFNFQAVAENHSLRTSLALMSQSEYNFMEDWSPGQAKEFKHTVIRMVLATDMSRHFEMLVQYKTKVVNSDAVAGKKGQEAFAAMDSNQRMMTLQMAMKVGRCHVMGLCSFPSQHNPAHAGPLTCRPAAFLIDSRNARQHRPCSHRIWMECATLGPEPSARAMSQVADLGHCMLPIEQHVKWVEALQEEMFRQGDREKELGLDVSPMMDRDKTGVNHPDSQVRRAGLACECAGSCVGMRLRPLPASPSPEIELLNEALILSTADTISGLLPALRLASLRSLYSH